MQLPLAAMQFMSFHTNLIGEKNNKKPTGSKDPGTFTGRASCAAYFICAPSGLNTVDKSLPQQPPGEADQTAYDNGMHQNSALVLFSGGQDSTVCLAWALERFERVETLAFFYGQRHAIELDVRQTLLKALATQNENWAERLGDDHRLELAELGKISETALTRDAEITLNTQGLPSTFVPGRNLLFLTYAAALGYRRGIATLVGGMCETDFSGYPDCRNETIRALEQSISLGMDKPVTIETPLMFIDKAQTWQMAYDIGGQELIDLIVEDTHTCYLGIRSRRHDWGYGCNHCPACSLRAKGWQKWQSARTN